MDSRHWVGVAVDRWNGIYKSRWYAHFGLWAVVSRPRSWSSAVVGGGGWSLNTVMQGPRHLLYLMVPGYSRLDSTSLQKDKWRWAIPWEKLLRTRPRSGMHHLCHIPLATSQSHDPRGQRAGRYSFVVCPEEGRSTLLSTWQGAPGQTSQ